MLSFELSILLTLKLVSIAFFLSGIEFWILSNNQSFFKVWSFENLRSDLESGLPFPLSIIKTLFSNDSFKPIIFMQIISSIFLLIHPHWVFVLILLITHILICIRFRGTFNGGSDMMKFVILSGTFLLLISDKKIFQQLGLYYICIHMFLSYFKAGWSKLLIRDWRSGQALPAFLSRSLFAESKAFSQFLRQSPVLSKSLSWFVILFELGILIILFKPVLIPVYFAIAMVFHFINYLFFGLNRFFWIWLSGWPALFYLKIF